MPVPKHSNRSMCSLPRSRHRVVAMLTFFGSSYERKARVNSCQLFMPQRHHKYSLHLDRPAIDHANACVSLFSYTS